MTNLPDLGTHHDYGRVTDQMYAPAAASPDEITDRWPERRRSRRRGFLRRLFDHLVISAIFGALLLWMFGLI